MKDEISNQITELEELSIQYPEQAKIKAEGLLKKSNLSSQEKILCLHIITNSWRTKNSYQNAAQILKEVDCLINEVKKENPEIMVSHYIEWARLAARFHKYNEAIRYIDLAVNYANDKNLEPMAQTGLAILADIKFEMQDIEGAWEILTELIAKESLKDGSIMLATFQVKLAEIYVYCNAYAQAKQLLDSAKLNALEEDQLFILITQLDFALSENDTEELKKLTQYIEVNPDYLEDPEILYLVIASWNQLKEYNKAEKAIKKLENHYLKSGHLHNLSYLYSGALEIYRSAGKYADGKLFFEKALKVVGENPQHSIMWILYNSYGRLLWENNEFQKAMKYFSKAVEYLDNYRISIPEDSNRIDFFADKVNYILDYIDFSLSFKDFNNALFFLESSKSLSLLDNLELNSQSKTLGYQELKRII